MDAEVLNAGGVQRLVIAADDSFASIPVFGVWPSIVYTPDAYLCEVILPLDSCQFSITKNGQVFVTSISFEVAKLTAELNAFLTQYAERRWLVYLLDNNDLTHVVGHPAHGGELQFGQTSGRRGGKNGSTFSLEISSLYLPYITDMGFEELTATSEKLDLRRYAKRDICMYQGDTVDVTFVLKNAAGEVVLLNGSTFEMRVATDPVIVYTEGNGLTISQDTSELRLLVTSILPVGVYVYDIQQTYPDGHIETIIRGNFIVESQV